MVKIGEIIIDNDLSYLNYNLEIMDETKFIYNKQKLKSYE
jgi:hypothetical protein